MSSAAGGSGEPSYCGNCRAPLQGPYCHQCGQPVRSPVRELWGLTREGLTELLAVDGKFFRSLIPLLLRPGELTREYFNGRRFSFIRPFRLYLGISLALFLLLSLRGDGEISSEPDPAGTNPSSQSAAPAEAADSAPAAADPAPLPDPKATAQSEPADGGAEPADGVVVQPGPSKRGLVVTVGGQQWDPSAQPLDIPYVPGWLDRFINRQLVIIVENGKRIENDPRVLIRSMLEHLPQSMFLLLPIFALLLKLLYLFKRRLYAEHLVVALHSHSFLFLSLLLILLLESLISWVPALESVLFWVQIGMLIWMPIYLLLMQKRVYRQGWVMTLCKYSLMGILYIVLIAITVTFAFLLALRFL